MATSRARKEESSSDYECDDLEPDRTHQFLLAAVEGHKISQFQFKRARDVKYVERSRPDLRRITPAEFGSAVERRPPKQVRLAVEPKCEVLFEGREGVRESVLRDFAAMRCETDAVCDFQAPVVCERQRPLGLRPPSVHRSRLALMTVKLQQCAWVGVDGLSGRHGSRREGLWLPPR